MNKWIVTSLVTAVALLGSPKLASAIPQESNDQTADEISLIREALSDYIQGSTNGQPERLKKVFHPALNLYSVNQGLLSVWSGKDYIKSTKEGQPTGETGKILSIDFEHDAAVAKVEIAAPNNATPYIDYFMLLKVKGKWTIIHKMYTKQDGHRGSFRANVDQAKASSNDQSSKPVQQNVPPQVEQHIDALFAENTNGNSPGVTLAVMQDGDVLFKKAYGNANLEHQIPIVPDTSIFNTGSCSKQVTAFAILLLCEQNKLSLDDDVRKYIPELHDYGTPITIRHLVHHTSGLRSDMQLLAMAGWSPGDCIDPDDILSMIYRQRELNFQPGEEFDYCNAGYDLLAEVVSRASGRSFAAFCKQQIFEPLEMHNSFFIEDRFDLIPNLVYPYGASPSATWRMVENSSYSGSTGFYTTVEDFAKWSLNFEQHRVGSEETLRAMDTPATINTGQTCDYAFGQFVEQYRGLKHIQHGGASSAYRAYHGRFPDQKMSIVMLGNSTALDVRAKSLAVADLFLSEHIAKDRNVDTNERMLLSAQELERFTGNYWNGKDRAVRVHVADSVLKYSIAGGPNVDLTPVGEARFLMLSTGTENTVRFDKDGSHYSMHTSSGGRIKETYQAYETTPVQLRTTRRVCRFLLQS